MKKPIIILTFILVILAIQVNCAEKFTMFSKIDKKDLKPSHMESLIKGSSFDPAKPNSQEKKEVKSAKEHNKVIKKAREMEMEVDMSAGVAEGLVKATEEAFKSMGADQKKLDFFENIIEMVEEVKEAEDNYLELVQEHEIQRKIQDKQLNGNTLSSSEEEDENDDYSEDDGFGEDILMIDLFEEGENEEEIIQLFGKNVNLDQVIDNDDQFFMQNSEDEEDQLKGQEILQQVENNMIIIEEELDELMGVAIEIEDEIDLSQNNSNKKDQQQALQIMASLDDQFQDEDILNEYNEDQEDDNNNNQDIFEEENDEFELDYLNNMKGIKENSEELTQLSADEQQKQQENLQQLEKLIQESQQRITADKIYGLLALGAGFSTIYICFFRNYQQKSDEEENKYNQYKQYSYLDEENNPSSQNDDQIQQQYQQQNNTPQEEDNGLGMIEDEDEQNNQKETPQNDKQKKEHVKQRQQDQEEEEELKTLNNSVCKDENEIDQQDKQESKQEEEELV